MLKAITRFSVSYPVSVSMIIIATLLLGFISFDKLGIDLFPNLHSPRLYIELVAGERPPEEMEEKVCGWGRITGHQAEWSGQCFFHFQGGSGAGGSGIHLGKGYE